MNDSLLMHLQERKSLNVNQLQCMIMSHQMQQAIGILQMPVMELLPAVEAEMEQNPLLEYVDDHPQDGGDGDLEDSIKDSTPEVELEFDEHDFAIMYCLDEEFRDYFHESEGGSGEKKQQNVAQKFYENSISNEASLFQHLMKQAQDVFASSEEMVLAERIIGDIDERGFLTTNLQEIAILQGCSFEILERVLARIRTFNPPGVGARDLRESLLIQLQRQGKQDTSAYKIIEQCFDDLLHNRITCIKKKLNCRLEQVDEAFLSIAKLDFHPGLQLSKQNDFPVSVDISIRCEGTELSVIINEESIPRLRLNRRYLRMLNDQEMTEEAKNFIRQKIVSAKWLFRILNERRNILEQIAEVLVKWQKEFFLSSDGRLVPINMRVMAQELQLNESTITRAVSNKYIDTPRGLFPLRFFFSSGLHTDTGEDISAHTVRDMIREIIVHEDSRHPLSDEAISKLIKDKGIQCARRTVTKYRTGLNLGNAQQRRK